MTLEDEAIDRDKGLVVDVSRECSLPGSEMSKSGMQDSAVGSLRNEALQRKERLIELRKQAHSKGVSTTSLSLDVEEKLPKPIFRNYKPISEGLKSGQLPEESAVNRELV